MKKRRFYRSALNHCYERTVNGCLCFYTISDYLVFFTILCVAARRYSITLIKVSLMPDHFHISCFCNNPQDLASFIRYTSAVYAMEFNTVCGRKGQLFHKSFGSAPKSTDKAIRTNLIYVDNNPRERYLCSKAEEYRWTFVAYSVSDHPFSERIDRRTAPSYLKNAMKLVEILNEEGKFLRHSTLYRMFSKLSKQQKESFIDFIISTYSVIDYKFSIDMFGSYENMLTADHASAGKEFDIHEEFNGKRDDVYKDMTRLLLVNGLISDIHEVVSMKQSEKEKLWRFLLGKTPATPRQIACFLHLPPQNQPPD